MPRRCAHPLVPSDAGQGAPDRCRRACPDRALLLLERDAGDRELEVADVNGVSADRVDLPRCRVVGPSGDHRTTDRRFWDGADRAEAVIAARFLRDRLRRSRPRIASLIHRVSALRSNAFSKK